MLENREAPTTPGDAQDSSFARRSSFRFSLGGLLVFMFGLGAGLSALRQPGTRWTDALMTAFGAWLVIGLANQVYDLGATLRHYRGGQQRFGLIFSLAWRFVLIAGLIGFSVLRMTGHEAVMWADRDDYGIEHARTVSAEGIWVLVILASCFSTVCFREWKSKGWWNRILNALGAMVGIAWCVVGTGDRWAVPYLVHLAIRNVETSQPLRRNGVDVYPARLHNELLDSFEDGALVSIGLTAGIVCLIILLARFWKVAGRRWLILITTAVCFTAQFALLAWCYRSFVRLSPFLAPSLSSRPWQNYLFGISFIALIAWLASYLLTRGDVDSSTTSSLTWRRRPVAYYHERLLVAALPAIALGAQTVESLLPEVRVYGISALGYLPLDVPMMLHVALLLLVIRLALRRWRHRDDALPLAALPLAPAKFMTLWAFSFAGACFIAASGSWFGFALLLSMRRS